MHIRLFCGITLSKISKFALYITFSDSNKQTNKNLKSGFMLNKKNDLRYIFVMLLEIRTGAHHYCEMLGSQKMKFLRNW